MAWGKEMSSTFIISQSFFVKTECEIQDGAKTALEMQREKIFISDLFLITFWY